jgi:hypothetical protein
LPVLRSDEPDVSSAFRVAGSNVVGGIDDMGDGDVDAVPVLTTSRVDPGSSSSSALLEPVAGAVLEPECCWSSADVDPGEGEGVVSDESDEFDGPDVGPEDDGPDDFAEFAPAAGFVDGPSAAGPEFGDPEFGDDASEAVD